MVPHEPRPLFSSRLVGDRAGFSFFARVSPRPRSRDLQAELLGLLELDGLLAALRDVLRLDAHDAATPAAAVLGVLVELGLEVGGERLEVLLVLLGDGRERDDCGALLVHESAQALLALDDAVGHILCSPLVLGSLKVRFLGTL